MPTETLSDYCNRHAVTYARNCGGTDEPTAKRYGEFYLSQCCLEDGYTPDHQYVFWGWFNDIEARRVLPFGP